MLEPIRPTHAVALCAVFLAACAAGSRPNPDAATAPDTDHACVDTDGDGHCAAEGDCRDDDPDVHPEASESCDGRDSDCDESVDEGCACSEGESRACGTTIGACTAGEQRCVAGEWPSCEGATGPAAEVCDGSNDDDCDSLVDEGCACVDGFARPCGTDVGACQGGTETCVDGRFEACAGAVGPQDEECDGEEDEDCDGTVDEGCSCTDGSSRTCGSSIGACVAGSQACATGVWGACAGGVGPTSEACDGGTDEDCDGVVDEGCDCVNGATRPCGSDTGACAAGTQTCATGAWQVCTGAILPVAEACDGTLDEDCDGVVDEGCDCIDGEARPCGTDAGVCEAGTQTCVSGAWQSCAGATSPGIEGCDGALDEDCDGAVDEGCECVNGASRPCGTDVGACTSGTESCAAGTWGACSGATGPITERCDGTADDDCDGVVDEGCECVDATIRPCGSDVGACVAGTQTCTTGFWTACAGATGPSTEACDGALDEDCDGVVDEGCACVDGATRACGTDVGACVAGTETCAAGAWGACAGEVAPALERCGGGRDEDCDGGTDEGCDCRVHGCAFGYCDTATGACDGTLPGYAVERVGFPEPPLDLLPMPSGRVYVGQSSMVVRWTDGVTSGYENLASLAGVSGGWQRSAVALTADGSGRIDYVDARYNTVGSARTQVEIGTLVGSPALGPHVVDLGGNYLVVNAIRDGADLHAVAYDTYAGSHRVWWLVVSGGAMTVTELPSIGRFNYSPRDVDLRLDAAGHVQVLLGGAHTPTAGQLEPVVDLIDWDPASGSYRWREWTLDSRTGGSLDGSCAFDRVGTPTCVVRRSTATAPAPASLAVHRFDGAAWTREDLPSRTAVEYNPALAFSSGNRPLVGLVRPTGEISYVHETTAGVWAEDVLANPPYATRLGTITPTYAATTELDVAVDHRDRPVFAFTVTSAQSSDVVEGTYVFVPLP